MSVRTGIRAAVLAGVALGLAGCSTTYYMVKDPTDGKTYYTTELHKSDGTVSFKDAKTLTDVTIQNSQVEQITKDQYTVAVGSH
jgi:hypothetical protein